jgi:hypothetical protein
VAATVENGFKPMESQEITQEMNMTITHNIFDKTALFINRKFVSNRMEDNTLQTFE